MVCIYQRLFAHVKVCSLLKSWVSVLELTFLGELIFQFSALLLRIMAKGNKNAEKDHFTVTLCPRESQSQKLNSVDRLFTNTTHFSLLHKCPKIPTMLAEIFQISTFFLFYSTISSFTSTQGYFLLICPFRAEPTMQRLSAAKLFLCRQTHKVAHDKEQLIIHAHYTSM